jgi:hypothetical protein
MIMKINMIVERKDNGYKAACAEHPISAEANSMADLINKTQKAAMQYFEGTDTAITIDNLDFNLDLKQFFQFYKLLNPKFVASELGINPTVFSRFIQGRDEPSPEETKLILEGLRKIGQELTDVSKLLKK